MSKIDLHTHTNHSDGELSPKELVLLAKNKGLKAIAIADHDTVSAVKECLSLKNNGLEIIPAIEIGIKNEEERQLKEVHVLGYFIDIENKNLYKSLDMLNKSKRRWLHKQIEILNRNGIIVNEEDVKKIAGLSVPRRPHIWKAIEENKQNKIPREDFFNRTAFGGEFYVEKDFEITLEGSVELIKKADGIPVLAHPGYYEIDNAVAEAVSSGIKG